MKFGYARISTSEQNVQRQIDSLKEQNIEEENIFIDIGTRKDFNRKNYQMLKNIVRKGDEIYFHELDRLGGNKKELAKEIRYFNEKEVVLRFLDIPTTLISFEELGKFSTEIMNLINHILIEVLSLQAEQEYQKIKKRQREGIEKAKAEGKFKGRKRTVYPEKIKRYIKLCREGKISKEILQNIMGYKTIRAVYYLLEREKEREEKENGKNNSMGTGTKI